MSQNSRKPENCKNRTNFNYPTIQYFSLTNKLPDSQDTTIFNIPSVIVFIDSFCHLLTKLKYTNVKNIWRADNDGFLSLHYEMRSANIYVTCIAHKKVIIVVC